MELNISHDRREETIEAKVKWFRTLNLSERMEMLCAYTDLALELNPQLPDKKYRIGDETNYTGRGRRTGHS